MRSTTESRKCKADLKFLRLSGDAGEQPSLLVGYRSGAERRWIEVYRASALGCFVRCRYSDCGVDRCRSFYIAGQPTVRIMRRIGVVMGVAESDPEAHARVRLFQDTLRVLG
jgi:hypothetical protein